MMTTDVMNLIGGLNLFRSVGEPNPFGYGRVKSWQDATHPDSVKRWRFLTLRGMNQIGTAVQGRSMNRYREWNDLVRPRREWVKQYLDNSSELAAVPEACRQAVWGNLLGDFLGLLLEEAYGDLHVPRTFSALLPIYEAGHFPCDWVGEEESPALVVY